ncbi:hypothetical protein Q4E40_02705 [Pontibacter sp. BT731]|uniref:hypothetical protein n=1 Tax=Pontibacter coccineus TaxID=3063328 RepID=UPI0026E2F21C|nr:hypothetical protein [Pontibacter sp. BT731]MDO6389023.1 hypothetical protein [Pontibacter sp. BT731]
MNKIKGFLFPLPFPICMVWHFILGGIIGALAIGPTYTAGISCGLFGVVAGLVYWYAVLKGE